MQSASDMKLLFAFVAIIGALSFYVLGELTFYLLTAIACFIHGISVNNCHAQTFIKHHHSVLQSCILGFGSTNLSILYPSRRISTDRLLLVYIVFFLLGVGSRSVIILSRGVAAYTSMLSLNNTLNSDQTGPHTQQTAGLASETHAWSVSIVIRSFQMKPPAASGVGN